jgi:glycosyltransferase involved in cell wall biosynthesis
VRAARSFPTRRPTVSIGVPVFNGEENLEAALTSVLDQTYEDFEVIIADNASTDATEEICRRFTRLDGRVRYVRNDKNVGVARNYNRLFELSDGRYFKWAPHDDRLSPEFLARCVEVLDADAEVAIVVPVPTLIDDEGRADDFQRRHRENLRARGLRHVDVDDPCHLAHDDPCSRFGDIVLRKVWFYELYGLMRADVLGRTGLLRLFHGSCQVLLAELALLGIVRQLPDELMFMRYPTFKILDAKRDMALKMDPEWSGHVFFPEVKVATEWLRVVGRSDLGRTAKLRCVASVGRKIARPDNLGKLVLPGPNNYLGINLSRRRKPVLKRR